MIAQFIMSRMGWSDAWFPKVSRPANPDPAREWWHPFIPPKGSVYVGVWTGKGGDMLCVKRCASNEESRAYASPPGRTLIDATLRAVALLALGPSDDGSLLCDTPDKATRSSRASRPAPSSAIGDGSLPSDQKRRVASDSPKSKGRRTVRVRGRE